MFPNFWKMVSRDLEKIDITISRKLEAIETLKSILWIHTSVLFQILMIPNFWKFNFIFCEKTRFWISRPILVVEKRSFLRFCSAWKSRIGYWKHLVIMTSIWTLLLFALFWPLSHIYQVTARYYAYLLRTTRFM